VHVIVQVFGKAVEVQVRSSSQHLWAELSEKLSDIFDPAIKYGGGPEALKQSLQAVSQAVAHLEGTEVDLAKVTASIAELPLGDKRTEIEARVRVLQEKTTEARRRISKALAESMEIAQEASKGRKQ
jgi:ppGpp synthetase/RelA/SpoT-type nucleotidyltranferase